jgi:hypothetical protein
MKLSVTESGKRADFVRRISMVTTSRKQLNQRKPFSLYGALIVSFVTLWNVSLNEVGYADDTGTTIAQTHPNQEGFLGVEPLDYPTALAELDDSLTFLGQPLNPRAVAALLPWLSDRLPGAIAVDIEGTTANTNQYYAEVFQRDDDWVFAEWQRGEEDLFVGYKSLGKLDSGMHVLRVSLNTGGSGVFPYLLVVDFNLDDEITYSQSRQRLIMTRRGEFLIGVDYEGDISVSGNEITFTPARDGSASETFLIE